MWEIVKFFCSFDERFNYNNVKTISVLHNARDNMYFKDGQWYTGDLKKNGIIQIDPNDKRASEHYIKLYEDINKKIFRFECGLCGKEFKGKDGLRRHIPVHTDVRPFACNVCQRAFRHQSTLIQHQVVHRTKVLFDCAVCSKSFTRKASLSTHMRTHTNLKRFHCQICLKSFHQRGNLTAHMYIHTGERPFKCDECDKSFNQKSNLNSHKKKIHLLKHLSAQPKETPNPLKSTLRNVLHKQKIKQDHPSLVNTILTIIKESPPPMVVERAAKIGNALAMYIVNGAGCTFRMVVKVFCIGNDECALVRVENECLSTTIVKIDWVIFREKNNVKDKMYTLNKTAKEKKELKFCDDFEGVHIDKYLTLISNQVVLSKVVEENDEDCDDPTESLQDASSHEEVSEKSDETNELIDICSDDSDRLIIDEDDLYGSVVEEVAIEETEGKILVELTVSNTAPNYQTTICEEIFSTDPTPMVWHSEGPENADDVLNADQIEDKEQDYSHLFINNDEPMIWHPNPAMHEFMKKDFDEE